MVYCYLGPCNGQPAVHQILDITSGAITRAVMRFIRSQTLDLISLCTNFVVCLLVLRPWSMLVRQATMEHAGETGHHGACW